MNLDPLAIAIRAPTYPPAMFAAPSSRPSHTIT